MSALSDTVRLADDSVRDLAVQRSAAIPNEMRKLQEEFATKGIVEGPTMGAMADVIAGEVRTRADEICSAIERAAKTSGLTYSRRVASALESLLNKLLEEQTKVVRDDVRRFALGPPQRTNRPSADVLENTTNNRAAMANSHARMELAHFVQSLRTTRREKTQSRLARAGWTFGGAIGGYLIKFGLDAAPQLWTAVHH